MHLYTIFRGEGRYFVARLAEHATVAAGPFASGQAAWANAERLAGDTATYGTWPAEMERSRSDYAARLGVDTLPRAAYIVRED